MSSFDYRCTGAYDDRDDCADAQRDLEEYALYLHEQREKALALLSMPAAAVIAHQTANYLAALVQFHASRSEDTTLADMLCDSVAERVVREALRGRESVLRQAVTQEGSRVLRWVLDCASCAFEKLLAAEASR